MRHAAQTTRPLAITVAVTASLALAGCSLGTDDAAEETGGTTEASDSGDQPSADQPSGSAASSGGASASGEDLHGRTVQLVTHDSFNPPE